VSAHNAKVSATAARAGKKPNIVDAMGDGGAVTRPTPE
jgi:hypothetical protein